MKLLTFPGQGSSISLLSLEKWCKTMATFQDKSGAISDLLEYTKVNPSKPESVALCSNLLFQEWLRTKNKHDKMMVLGHSLGELSAINAGTENTLFSARDIFQIAAKRNDLMVQATHGWLKREGRGLDEKFKLLAVRSPRSKDLRRELCLRNSLHIATHVNAKICVLTGLQQDFEALQLPYGARTSELVNIDGIPFHDSRVLKEIMEPLYDYLWEKIKHSGIRSLKHQLICNADGSTTDLVDIAIEKYVQSSTQTVETVECLKKIAELGTTSALHFGPGPQFANMLKRDMNKATHEYYGE
ncbi:HCL366Wp [Eremothecium sinecaudum]|uniref:[acyl-carrier-protein] S-malonyltransferase n=1 Tax=Eremothecium sinecaudum TaxID=45286 RepID=A0A120K1V4_9SACH|nr:HCL366Wp [Eremothecium sinecaudum]AMD19785.1 HCL366Wp [Eremothecium sinecaudum]